MPIKSTNISLSLPFSMPTVLGNLGLAFLTVSITNDNITRIQSGVTRRTMATQPMPRYKRPMNVGPTVTLLHVFHASWYEEQYQTNETRVCILGSSFSPLIIIYLIIRSTQHLVVACNCPKPFIAFYTTTLTQHQLF